jgi:hypothetical protein
VDLELLVRDVAVTIGVDELPQLTLLVRGQLDVEARQATDEFATIDAPLTK